MNSLLYAIISGVVGVIFAITTAIAEVPRITKEETKAMLGSPDLVIIDVRTSTDWNSSDSKIKTAVRRVPKEFDKWIDDFPKDKTLIFYCS